MEDMTLPTPTVCHDCGILLRDGVEGLECPACGHTIAYAAVFLPAYPGTGPGIHGG
jgi:predicted RNA-binding Zn-ribbon protein involved in translation (DUF1610 family)